MIFLTTKLLVHMWSSLLLTTPTTIRHHLKPSKNQHLKHVFRPSLFNHLKKKTVFTSCLETECIQLSLFPFSVDVLLSNIDNFATAWAKMSDEEDSVITTLQGLGASTFLALLERSNLMDTLTNDGIIKSFQRRGDYSNESSCQHWKTYRAVDRLCPGQQRLASSSTGIFRSHYEGSRAAEADPLVPHRSCQHDEAKS